MRKVVVLHCVLGPGTTSHHTKMLYDKGEKRGFLQCENLAGVGAAWTYGELRFNTNTNITTFPSRYLY